jgi:lipopolysaccharide biosynthesis protein
MARGAISASLYRLYVLVRRAGLPMLGHEIMRHRSPKQAVLRWPEGEIPLGPKVCVFVHWDGGGEVREHVLHQVRSLASVGMSVLFVSNAGQLRPAALEALKLVCAGILVRRNVGYDFGAWREGFEQLGLPRANTTMVVMANDSVYGPIRSLSEMFAAVDFEVADVWGATDSWQSRYHLQSYLMVFSPKVVGSEAWAKFWGQVRPTWSKIWLIRLYELGLTQSMLKAGFRCRAIWPYQSLITDIDLTWLETRKDDEEGPNMADPMNQARQRHVYRLRDAVTHRLPLNPTSDLWRQLLQARYPFLKRELLRNNPTHVPDVVEWRDVVRELSDSNLGPIERDLQRTLKNQTP